MPVTVTSASAVPDDAALVGVPVASDSTIDSELADQSKCFDIDVTESQGQLSLGMRVISALCRSLTHRCSQGTALLRRVMR